MRRLLLGVLLALACLPLAGCGGCESAEARMRRKALGNVPDDEDSPPPAVIAAADATAAPPAVAPPATAANGETAPAAPSPPAPPAAAPPMSPTNSAAAASAADSSSAPMTPASVASAQPPPPAQPSKVVTPVAPPATPLAAHERRARSIDNMKRIGQALVKHVTRTKAIPAAGNQNAVEELMLSWRVAILPELGYANLHRQFHHNEPWDSPHNKQLLPLIPPEFTSPERFDEKTNYQGLAGVGQSFHYWKATPLDRVKDGLANTIVLVEVDDSTAVPWTKPADFGPSVEEPRTGISGLRPEGAFALLGDGRLVSLRSDIINAELLALFSIAGGEPADSVATLQEPAAEGSPIGAAVPAAVVAAAAVPVPADTQPQPPLTIASTRPSAADIPGPLVVLPGEKPLPAAAGVIAVPAEENLAAARKLFREVYGERHEKSKRPEDRKKLAQFLLAEADKVAANPAHHYELLRITRDVAVSCGDTTTALAATDLIVGTFAVDKRELECKVLEDLAKTAQLSTGDSLLCDRSRALLRETFDADQFELALRAYDVLLECTRSKGDRWEAARLSKQRQPLEAARETFREAAAAVQALKKNPADSAANETLGKYLCFVKNQWAAGLPYLARCAEIKLRVIASIDLEPSRSPQETFSLADQYWEMAKEHKQPHARGLQLRAVYLYQVAINQLPGGLEKVKAEQRIDEARGIYGEEEVNLVLTAAGLPVSDAVAN